MFGNLPTAIAQASPDSPLATSLFTGGEVLAPLLILVLCVVAGVGTLLLLPSRREQAIRSVGAVVLLAAALILVAVLVRYAAAHGGGIGTYFWTFTAIGLTGAVRVITHPKPVYSALYFVLTVFATSGLYVLVWAEFMAAALVLIYAGAILITYVFVIMLASQASTDPNANAALTEYDRVSREPLAAAAVGFAMMGVLLFVIFDRAPTGLTPINRDAATGAITGESQLLAQTAGSTQKLGVYLFQNHFVNLQLAALLLTVAMVGAILIARRRVFVPGAASIASMGRAAADVTVAPMTPVDDNPHSIPVYGTDNPRQKAYPET